MPNLSWLPALQPRIETLCGSHGVPLGVPVGWIQVESGGRLNEVTSLDERGLFQLTPEESSDLQLDHHRLSVDVDYSLRAGFLLVGRYRTAVNLWKIAQLVEGSEFFWRLVKFAHSIGGGAARTIARDAVASSFFADWGTFTQFCASQDGAYLSRLHHSPMKWVGLVNRMFDIGRPYSVEALVCQAPGS